MSLEPVTAAAVLLAGALIGATGIGGVLVVPALTQFAGLDLPRAIAASAAAFALPGIAAVAWLRRDGAWQPRWFVLLAAALPAAAVGAALVHHVRGEWLLAGIGLLALSSGGRSLWQAMRGAQRAQPGAELSTGALAALGGGVGLASGLTGTGGPVVLVPALVLLRQPTALVVAAAQAIQLPVALTAGAAHVASGALDLPLALLLGALLLAGSFLGQGAARRLPVARLQLIVSLLLVGVGLWFGWRVAAPHFS
ncbi:MAG TPA: sulfite exporter TauE/SafE family protein [Ramlibacter sp.]|nr:sulfite exporter TauE/SafE family protein [Ramlibacter sp.]